MIVVAVFVLLAWAGFFVALLRLHTAITDTDAAFRVLAGGYGDAGRLVARRRRFRRRQRRAERAVASATTGFEVAHAAIAQRLGVKHTAGAGIYAHIRGINRGLGRAASALFAPKAHKHGKRLPGWRKQLGSRDEKLPNTRDPE